ncbi:hypothetical protein KUCAC02_000444 [Chaenocephalus aceratus]|uniref:Uncharacterized protein n=1 Tax=Chaenocephalus aceratus TaxID=36190 RepID=A0ACB9W739_CHAAC|nr:hypothetical protein KUCAC02_000444 [Chaenocephalus aceratus]
MSCRKRCKREIFKFAQYLYRLVTGTLNTASWLAQIRLFVSQRPSLPLVSGFCCANTRAALILWLVRSVHSARLLGALSQLAVYAVQ